MAHLTLKEKLVLIFDLWLFIGLAFILEVETWKLITGITLFEIVTGLLIWLSNKIEGKGK